MFDELDKLTTALVDLRNEDGFTLAKYKYAKEVRKCLQAIKVECGQLRNKVSEEFKAANKKSE